MIQSGESSALPVGLTGRVVLTEIEQPTIEIPSRVFLAGIQDPPVEDSPLQVVMAGIEEPPVIDVPGVAKLVDIDDPPVIDVPGIVKRPSLYAQPIIEVPDYVKLIGMSDVSLDDLLIRVVLVDIGDPPVIDVPGAPRI